MGPVVYAIIGLNVLYWVFMENVSRRDEGKKVGFDSHDTAKKEFESKSVGNTSYKIAASQFLLYIGSIVLRKMKLGNHPIAAFHGPEFTPGGIAAIVVTVLCFALRYWAMETLGKFFSRKLGIQGDKHQVVRNGPYAVVRNPGYSANLFLFLTYTLVVTGDILFGVVLFLQWLYVMLAVRIKGEEEMLLTDKATGDAYKKYMQDVKYKLIPFVV